MNDTIAILCKELRLGKAIAENYGKIQAQTHEEFLEKVLKIETENRKLARKNRYLKQANFEIVKTFENYDFSRIKLPNTVSAEGLKNGNFIDRKENLILYGPVGTRKTHLITAIGVQACDSEKTVRFYRTMNLVNELVESQKEGTLPKFLEKLAKIDLLICDEWGYIPLDRQGAQLLFQVIA